MSRNEHNPNKGAYQSVAPRAFTLVELLVVVTIIAMLVGLLMPAVIASRARARMVQCTNNQKELATAIFSYEHAKRHLPGFVNRVRGTQVSWVPVLFPYLGRMDLWEGQNGWRSGFYNGNHPYETYIGQLVCPNDVTNTGVASLSYVVELGIYTDPADIEDSAVNNGVFRDYYNYPSTTAITLSDIRSPAQTVMISEIHNGTRLWSQPVPTQVGFFWPANISALNATLIGQSLPGLPAPVQAAHRGTAIVTFCDGHVEEIPEDTQCRLYQGAW